MHCEDIVDPAGSWQQSWMALERAYAEGFIASMAVSNFDTELLEMLTAHGFNKPHVVQNFADLEDLDLEVRMWCADHDVVFVPYASRRHVDRMSGNRANTLTAIAEKYGVSKHLVVSKFFLQIGTAVIPRTSNVDHLVENIVRVYDFTLTNSELEALGWPYANRREEEL
jgi:diketogulonate reductase-like aldo/keto reductase